jgi:hypothetical protein
MLGAWNDCPWCGTPGATLATQRECREFSKADINLMCDACGHEHHPVNDTQCTGEFGGWYAREPCDCTSFERKMTPCQKELSGGGPPL